MNEEENQKERIGNTVITSVSVSKEFAKFISQYDLSPTECFRKGIAVNLFDLGVEMYQSKKNKERLEYVNKFLKKIEEDEKLREKFEQIKLFEAINNNFSKIKHIIKDLE